MEQVKGNPQNKNIQSQAGRAKQDAAGSFLSMMSHELRTPLNAIIGLTTAAQADQTGKTDDYLRKIRAQSQYLLRMVNDMLEVADLNAGDVRVEDGRYHLHEALAGVRLIAEEKCAAKDQTFRFAMDAAVPADVQGDGKRVAHVLLNILDNASKFAPPGGWVSLTAQAGEKAGEVAFVVEDNGPGVPPQRAGELFREFAFETGETCVRSGPGLGLNVAKRLAVRMGGDVAYRPAAGGGSAFTFTLPVRPANGPQPDAPLPPAEVLTGKTLLVAEDVAINREVLLALLAHTGVTIECAENGAEAYEMFRSKPGGYDLIFMDLNMPGVDGYEATRKIRSLGTPPAATVPIIALTANTFEEDIRRCMESGMDGHIAKPVDMGKVMDAMLKYFA